MSVKISVNDNSKTFLSEFEKKLELALIGIGEKAESYAKRECPVDTGRLRNSINYASFADEQAVYVGTNVEYAIYVEFRDNAKHTSGNSHFLRNAAANHTDEYKEIAESVLKK